MAGWIGDSKWQEELDKLHTKNLCQSLEDGMFFQIDQNSRFKCALKN